MRRVNTDMEASKMSRSILGGRKETEGNKKTHVQCSPPLQPGLTRGSVLKQAPWIYIPSFNGTHPVINRETLEICL